MLITVFCCLLFASWLAAVMTAFCPLRAYQRRKELETLEDQGWEDKSRLG